MVCCDKQYCRRATQGGEGVRPAEVEASDAHRHLDMTRTLSIATLLQRRVALLVAYSACDAPNQNSLHPIDLWLILWFQ